MRVRASWALPVLSSRSASKAAGRGQGSRAPRPGTVATTGLNSGRTMPQGQLGPFRGPGREAKQEGVGHKLTWHLLACFQVLPGWNSPRGHLIELPRLNQNFMSAPQDPPPNSQSPVTSTFLLDSFLKSISTLFRDQEIMEPKYQRGPWGAGMEPGITGNRNGGVGPPVPGER